MGSLDVYSVKNLEFYYDKNFSINIKEFVVQKGSVVCIAGPNGAGKTTFMKILAFILKHKRGIIKLYGKEIKAKNLQKVRKNVTMIFEEPLLFKRNVYKNIIYTLGLTKKKISIDNISYYLKLVGLDAEKFYKRKYYQLSNGEKKRLSIAMQLSLDRDIIIFDEPTSNIDENSKHFIEKAIFKEKEKGKTILVVSHDIFFITKIADKIHYMYNGRLYNNSFFNILENYNIIDEKGRSIIEFPDGQSIELDSVKKDIKKVALKGIDINFSFSIAKTHNIIEARIISISIFAKRRLLLVDLAGNFCYIIINLNNNILKLDNIFLFDLKKYFV
ncbi:MAG: ABC transporter ATP-binding protein, partial [Deferribacterota bacterium]|nr:ABC transporter ATP-binding protein [Deferribacterota bacterium]